MFDMIEHTKQHDSYEVPTLITTKTTLKKSENEKQFQKQFVY